MSSERVPRPRACGRMKWKVLHCAVNVVLMKSWDIHSTRLVLLGPSGTERMADRWADNSETMVHKMKYSCALKPGRRNEEER